MQALINQSDKKIYGFALHTDSDFTKFEIAFNTMETGDVLPDKAWKTSNWKHKLTLLQYPEFKIIRSKLWDLYFENNEHTSREYLLPVFVEFIQLIQQKHK